MSFWSRFRRAKPEPPATATAAAAPRPAPSGGWRAAPPMEGVIQRAAMPVSDGLRFRNGLTSWQDHTFGTTMGHSVTADAPGGVIHGLARPTGFPSEAHGGESLTVALRYRNTPGPDGTPDPSQPSPAPQPQRPKPPESSRSSSDLTGRSEPLVSVKASGTAPGTAVASGAAAHPASPEPSGLSG
ncbi:hypothetical protein, partial [Saccharothrix hoggarensis]